MYRRGAVTLSRLYCRRLGGVRRRYDTPVFSRSFSSVRREEHEELQLVDALLKDRIQRGELRPDRAQERAARRLTRLQEALVGYTNEPLIERNLQKEKEMRQKEESSDEEEESATKGGNTDTPKKHEPRPIQDDEVKLRVPRGLFLHGDVGTGKSMLMDIFYEQASVERKQRVHFHAFLQKVHQRIFELKQADLQKYGRNFAVDTSLERNPIYRVAEQLSTEVQLLCFDEFQVTDVADALILRQLFEVLFANGTVMVATSNRPPSDLYEGGINRSYFVPFIDLLYKQCIVHEMQSNIDYRQVISKDLQDFFLVSNDDSFLQAAQVCDETFARLLNGREATRMDLSVGFNRTLTAHHADKDGIVARFQFEELCDNHLGSGDYRAVAQNFDVVILERIPLLTLKEHDQARRFITLVDELYEHKCALMCTAVAHPNELFLDYSGEKILQEKDSIETKVGEMFGIDVAQSSGKTAGELASVRELPFAFRRASSRLTEMCSRQWWEKVL